MISDSKNVETYYSRRGDIMKTKTSLSDKNKSLILELIQDQKQSTVEGLEDADGNGKIKKLENDLNVLTSLKSAINENRQLTTDEADKALNILFLNTIPALYDGTGEDPKEYYSIASKLGINDKLEALIQVYENAVFTNN